MDTIKIITGINSNVLLYFAGFYKMISMVMKNLLYIHKKIIIFISIFISDSSCGFHPVVSK
jgi:hypothetical protein